MPTTTIKSSSLSSSPLNNNVRQQIISKTPRVNQRKSNKKQKETVEATTGIFQRTVFIFVKKENIKLIV